MSGVLQCLYILCVKYTFFKIFDIFFMYRKIFVTLLSMLRFTLDSQSLQHYLLLNSLLIKSLLISCSLSSILYQSYHLPHFPLTHLQTNPGPFKPTSQLDQNSSDCSCHQEDLRQQHQETFCRHHRLAYQGLCDLVCMFQI